MPSKSKIKIIAFVGLPFTGKSTAREITQDLLKARGVDNEYVYFGSVGEVERRNAASEWDEQQAKMTFQQKEQYIRELWREELGMSAMAVKAMPEIEKHIKDGKVVLIDNLYSEAEREILVEKYGEGSLVLVAMAADWPVRVRRAATREYRPLTEEELRVRDDAEIRNLQKAPPIARAQVTIVNNDDGADFEAGKSILRRELENRLMPLVKS